MAAFSCRATEKLGNSNLLYYKKKNPVELKHCQTSCSYRIFYPMQPKPQKEKLFLIFEFDYVTRKPTIGVSKGKRNEAGQSQPKHLNNAWPKPCFMLYANRFMPKIDRHTMYVSRNYFFNIIHREILFASFAGTFLSLEPSRRRGPENEDVFLPSSIRVLDCQYFLLLVSSIDTKVE